KPVAAALQRLGRRGALLNQTEQSVPAHALDQCDRIVPRPAPDWPSIVPLAYREEDHLGATNQIFQRDVTYSVCLAEHAAVDGVVAVITHHEVMARRHLVHLRVVIETIVDKIERGVAHAIRQCFAPALDARGSASFLSLDEILDTFALDRNV